MSDDLERRLRDSLRAYAELVDEPDAGAPPVRAATTSSRGVRRWRGALLAAAAAAAVVSGSVWFVSDHDTVSATGSVASDAQASADRAESDTGAAMAAPSDGALSAAEAPGATPQVGVAYPVDLLTHCGVVGIDIGGVWFAADPPLVEAGGNPPAGWGNPYQPGTVTLQSSEQATFTDDAGHLVRLRADESARPSLCE